MSKGEELFRRVREAPDAGAAVASMPRKKWKRLFRHLLRESEEDLLAIMMADATRRMLTGGKKS